MGGEENVKVAVRVRPFNKRERARNASLIVEMKGNSTYLQDPENTKEEPRNFTFDHSYWSHDGCKEGSDGYYGPDSSHKNGKKFSDQKKVFDDLGAGVLKNAWEGYNSTLFAYGQTGSGKSWSVVGYGVNKGIVPQFCDTLYQGMDKKKSAGEKIQFEVTFSMLEIYNEVVRDLLNPKKSGRGGLRVRQHPKKGFYAEGLKMCAVGSYQEIEGKMEEGTMNRTVASTNMNATSSRAHTIVGITFVQKFKNAAGEETAKTAVINLVDLAGSERAESTGATGDRLKEGAAINQSLSCLGNCIAAMADRSSGNKRVKVPFRDSVLTKLLKNALGGNSKTIMIAAISPADINYDETLSTLRYADRAKQIKTQAKVNEDPTEKLIRELQEENDKLKAMLESGGVVVPKGDGEEGIEEDDDMTAEEKAALKQELEDEYKAQLEENAREMEEMKKEFEEKLKEAHDGDAEVNAAMSQMSEKRKGLPHISNLNMDPQLSGHIVHFIDEEIETIGNGKSNGSIKLLGPSIDEKHATMYVEKERVYIEKASDTARVLINGKAIDDKVELKHNDRLMFGTTQMFVFVDPKEKENSKKKYETVTYEMFQEEIAANSGFDMNTENKSKEDMLLQEELVDMLPTIDEANSISEELDKKKKFEVMLISAEARGELKGRTQIFVKVVDLETDLEWMWPKEKFNNRKYVMQEMFENYKEGDKWQLPADRDPFEEDYNSDVQVGSIKVWLQSLAYKIEMKEQLDIVDFRGNEIGLLNIEMNPCDAKGQEYADTDDVWVNDCKELVGKDYNFITKITSARGLPNIYSELYTKFVMYLDNEATETNRIKDTANPDWKFSKQFSYTPATDQFVNYLSEGAVMVQIWGKYKPPKGKKNVNTKAALGAMMMKGSVAAGGGTQVKTVDTNRVKHAMEMAMMRKRQEKLELKVNQFKKLVELAEQHKKPRLSTSLVRDLLHAPNQETADKCLKMVPKEVVLEGEEEIALKGTTNSTAPGQNNSKQPEKQTKVKQPEPSKPAAPKREKTNGLSVTDSKKKSCTCVLL